MSLSHSKKITSKTVGEFFKVVGGGTPTTANPDFWKGSIPWVTSADLGNDLEITPRKAVSSEAIASSATNLVPAGSVIVATRVGLGKVGIAATDLCFSQDCQGVILDSKTCDSKFIAHQLKQHVQIFKHISRGTTIAGVTKKQLLDLQFDLPSLLEQKRIVAEIEKQFTRLDAGVAALKRVQANLKRYRAAVLKAACEGKLVPTEAELHSGSGVPPLSDKETQSRDGSATLDTYEPADQLLARILIDRRKKWNGKGKYKEPAAPDTSNLPGLPEGWMWSILDTLAEIKGGITKDQKRKFTVPARSIPYLRVANVQRGYLDLTEIKEIVATEEEISELALKSGDILFNEGGDRDKLGRGWIWNDEISECIHQNHVFRARLFDKSINSKLVSWYANTYGQQFFFDEGKHTTNLASISMSKLKCLPVPIPPPAEQIRIVAEVDRRLSVVEELEAVVDANLQRATRLRQAILQKAFSGGFN